MGSSLEDPSLNSGLGSVVTLSDVDFFLRVAFSGVGKEGKPTGAPPF